MSLTEYIGAVGNNILLPDESHCKMVRLPHPILTNRQLDILCNIRYKGFKTVKLPILFKVDEGADGLQKALSELCRSAEMSVDQGVKRLLERLEENGQLDNTMIFFTSDNGAVIDGPLPLNGNQAGYKSLTYPGGVHTPMFVYWKGHLESGSYDKLVSAMDFYPTALDAAGIPIPEDLKLDGVSLLPYLTGENKGNPHESLVWLTSFSLK